MPTVPTDPVLAARAAIGVAARLNDPEALAIARRGLAAAKLERAAKAAPPLTDEQVQRITAILRGGAA